VCEVRSSDASGSSSRAQHDHRRLELSMESKAEAQSTVQADRPSGEVAVGALVEVRTLHVECAAEAVEAAHKLRIEVEALRYHGRLYAQERKPASARTLE